MAGTEDDSRLLRQKRNFILKETARNLADQSKHYDAAAILEDEIDAGTDAGDLHDKLLMVESYIRLGREIKAEKSMDNVRLIFLKSPQPNKELVKVLAESYHTKQAYVRELFARKLLSEMYLASTLPVKEIFDGASQCLHDIQSVARRLHKVKSSKKQLELQNLQMQLGNNSDDDESETQKKQGTEGQTRLQIIALDYGLRYMWEIYKHLEKIQISDSAKKTRDLAKCTNAIGYFYGFVGDQKRSMATREKGIKMMNAEFGDHAVDYNLYGDLHHNVAVSLFNMEKFAEAKGRYEKAIDAYSSAVDYPNQEMRNKDLKQSQSDLRQTRNRL